METSYDVIVLGTGLKECILSGLCSVNKKKVLHMDRNPYYGGESASLNAEQLYKRFRSDEKVPDDLGRTRDYNVDLCPKFLMACGNLVKVLLHTKVTRYLEFKSVAGSFVRDKDGKIHKVPATAKEALSSQLMGMFQKRRFKNFVEYVNSWEPDDAKTHDNMDLNKVTSRQLMTYFKLDDNTVSFTGHSLALYPNDDYLDRPAREMVERAKLYAYSMSRYGNSPYIYPVYGLGGLPEGFSRLCAIHGGVYMLNKPIDKILYDESGKVKGVESEGKPAYCKQLIGDPSYFMGTDKIKKTGQIARCICIFSHPIENTSNADSCQIVIPALAVKGRKNDLYVSMVSYHHKVAAKGKYVAVCSAIVEQKADESELKPCLDLLGKIDQKFFWVSDSYEPCNEPAKDNVFITRTFDATTHFESATSEVLDLYYKISGSKIDLSVSAEPDDLGAADDAAAGTAAAAAAEASAADVAEIEKALAKGEEDEGTKEKAK